MAKDNKDSLGIAGEQQAVKYLLQKGYRILKRNFRTRMAEIDIIAQKDDTICFIEVKTRRSANFGLPEEFVDQEKIKKIVLGAKAFLQHGEFEHCFKRFDIISVIFRDNRFYIEHLADAFDAT